jgi:hypothetical protein
MTGGLSGCNLGLEGETTGLGEVVAPDAAVNLARDAGLAGFDGSMLASDPGIDAALGSGSGSYAVPTATSPLCGVGACDPDEDTECDPDAGATFATDAGVAADDGGEGPDEDAAPAYDAGSVQPSVTAYACHVTASSSEGGTSPATSCTAAGKGHYDAACGSSSDCAPGYECVQDDARAAQGGAVQAGVCRRYCCGNTCPGTQSFCAIEMTLTGGTEVPVCVVRPTNSAVDSGGQCELLQDSTCGAGLTCQVASDGASACVMAGTATAGQSCETENCAAGLSCVVGYFPSRTCAQLCDLSGDGCPPGQKCADNPTVTATDGSVGVCTQES